MVLVQDTKRPNKDPFEVSEKAFEGLQRDFGGRYKSVKKVIVTPDKIVVTPSGNVPPAKTKSGK